MLSGLSKCGTPRCFDALKYGAVDFVSKDSFFKGIDGTAHTKLVTSKVIAAAEVSVSSMDLMRVSSDSKIPKKHETVVFCEECGTRNTSMSVPSEEYPIQCRKCGDEISSVGNKRYRRMDYLTVIGTGTSGYGNLLKIIPELPPDMAGSIFVMILDTVRNVKSFGKYLDSMCDFQVVFGEDGTTIESGYCYLFSGEQNVTLSPYSGQYSLQIDRDEPASELGAIDKLMGSVASILGDRVSGVLLSGEGFDGSWGMKAIKENNGNCMVLSPEFCLAKTMVSRSLTYLNLPADLDEFTIALGIKKNHMQNKENVITA
jgi:two-component system chemotaxis response regulator CheB